MSILIRCLSCGNQAKAPDNAAGRKTKCPKCGMSLVVPALGGVSGTPSSVAKVANRPSATSLPRSKSETVAHRPIEDYKACPFCSEQVLAAAKKCKHCGETIDVALRAAEESRRTAEQRGNTPMVFMNAGGGAAVVDASPRSPQKSGGTAAMLELLPGFFLGTFGIGHMYAGNVGVGLLFMFGWWFLLFVNILLCFVFVGFLTLPLCWIAIMIASPLIAANSCK